MVDEETKTQYENSISDIRRYFEEGERALAPNEFTEFWKSLSEGWKEYLRTADLQRS